MPMETSSGRARPSSPAYCTHSKSPPDIPVVQICPKILRTTLMVCAESSSSHKHDPSNNIPSLLHRMRRKTEDPLHISTGWLLLTPKYPVQGNHNDPTTPFLFEL